MSNKIFLVEDSLTQLEQIKIVIEGAGYEYDFAKDGREALGKIKTDKPILVISDIVMPEMDGYELCKAIKSDEELKHIPVMLLTTLSDPHDVIKGLEAGADNFLTKPYKEEMLLSRIKYVLINSELRKASVMTQMGIDIVFGGKKYHINSDRIQIVDLLLSTYENAIQKNTELMTANRVLAEMHNELAQKNKQLEKLNEEKGKFMKMAAHDIRNPVGIILSYSSLILEDMKDNLTEDQLEFIGIIRRSSDFVLQLLNELLNVSVIESGQLSLNLEEIDFNEMINMAITYNKITADKKNMKMIFNSEFKNCKVKVDKVKIEQVINNMITNAIKYSYPDTEINIRLYGEDEQAVVCVEDHGQGIRENEMKLLFKSFSKTSATPTGGESSTGLGLSIVKKIVEAHNGKVWAESEYGKGSKFYFSVPVS